MERLKFGKFCQELDFGKVWEGVEIFCDRGHLSRRELSLERIIKLRRVTGASRLKNLDCSRSAFLKHGGLHQNSTS